MVRAIAITVAALAMWPVAARADRIAFRRGGTALHVVSAAGGDVGDLAQAELDAATPPAIAVAGAIASPDGKRIAYACEDARAVCIADRDGGNAQTLATTKLAATVRGWSADGARVTWAERATDSETLWSIAVAGGGAAKRGLVAHVSGIHSSVALSANGRYAWVADQRIHIAPAAGGAEVLVGPPYMAGAACQWSPDGAQLACEVTQLRDIKPWTMSLIVFSANGKTSFTLDRDRIRGLRWSPDSAKLTYGKRDGLAIVDATAGSTPVLLTRATTADAIPVDIPVAWLP